MRCVAISLLLTGVALPATLAATNQRAGFLSGGTGFDLEANDTNVTTGAPTLAPTPVPSPAPTPAPTPDPNGTVTTPSPAEEGGLPSLELRVLMLAGLLFVLACCCLLGCQESPGGPPNEYEKAIGVKPAASPGAVQMTSPAPKRASLVAEVVAPAAATAAQAPPAVAKEASVTAKKSDPKEAPPAVAKEASVTAKKSDPKATPDFTSPAQAKRASLEAKRASLEAPPAVTAQVSDPRDVVNLLKQVEAFLQNMDALRQQLAEKTQQEQALRDQLAATEETEKKASLAVDVEAAAGEREAVQTEMDTLDADFGVLAGKCQVQEELAPTFAKVQELMTLVRTEETRIHEKRAKTASKFGPSKAGGRKSVQSNRSNVTEKTGDTELQKKLANRRTKSNVGEADA